MRLGRTQHLAARAAARHRGRAGALERLSSGLRIRRAADEAAGLSAACDPLFQQTVAQGDAASRVEDADMAAATTDAVMHDPIAEASIAALTQARLLDLGAVQQLLDRGAG